MRHLTSVAFLLALTTAASGCKKKTPPEVTVEPAAAPAPVVAAAPKPVPPEVIKQMVEHFGKVHYEFDSAKLTAGSLEALAANAKIMQKYPRLQVEVQGHADERGTTDYNLALGDRRADAVSKYLAEMGISASRVRKLSYGEEKPAAAGSNESAWSANRRCEFRILTVEPTVEGTVGP